MTQRKTFTVLIGACENLFVRHAFPLIGREQDSKAADLLIVLGTSLVVYVHGHSRVPCVYVLYPCLRLVPLIMIPCADHPLHAWSNATSTSRCAAVQPLFGCAGEVVAWATTGLLTWVDLWLLPSGTRLLAWQRR